MCIFPVNMLDLIWISSEVGQMILAHWLASRLDPFGQNLTLSGFAQYDLGHLWKNATESESGKLIAGRLRPARNQAL